MDNKETLRQLISETPKYLTHVTVGIWLIQNLLKDMDDLEKRVRQLEDEQRRQRDA